MKVDWDCSLSSLLLSRVYFFVIEMHAKERSRMWGMDMLISRRDMSYRLYCVLVVVCVLLLRVWGKIVEKDCCEINKHNGWINGSTGDGRRKQNTLS